MSKRKRLKKRKIRVIGCARSGTLYTRGVLKSKGLKIGHEYCGDDGTVSHLFVEDYEFPVVKYKYPPGRCCHVGEQPSDFSFEHTVHQVRDPLKCIDSIKWVRAPWDMVSELTGESLDYDNIIDKAAAYLLHWNKFCQERAEITYRIEDQLPDMLNHVGLDPSIPKKLPKTRNHSHRYTACKFPKQYDTYQKRKDLVDGSPPPEWGDITPSLRRPLKKLFRSYGYA